ncbi:MAG: hypothetical protein A2Y66_01695 [Nitrospirae bacterium RBG_13_41_22]|nr:MAG: hypothetical protein A2Y66_01695 [Nitrospirae bacterium RBG_13_41_22]
MKFKEWWKKELPSITILFGPNQLKIAFKSCWVRSRAETAKEIEEMTHQDINKKFLKLCEYLEEVDEYDKYAEEGD